jgi:hypothetical protein
VRAGIDITFDFRSDTPPSRDPDTFSPTLGRCHELLWNKPLPNGARLDLTASRPPVYLHHHSDLGEFWLSSDSVIHTYTSWESMRPITEQIPEAENESFRRIAYTIGAMMVWPANRVGGKQTINGARGFIRSISDRFDLTVECVRRYYLGIHSPLDATFARYHDFFALFVDFRGFVDFFLLQDIVREDYSTVAFFMPFGDFKLPAVPRDLPTYVSYRRHSIEFVHARNERISRLHPAREAGNPPEASEAQPSE